jgi:hypothetical protein
LYKINLIQFLELLKELSGKTLLEYFSKLDLNCLTFKTI